MINFDLTKTFTSGGGADYIYQHLVFQADRVPGHGFKKVARVTFKEDGAYTYAFISLIDRDTGKRVDFDDRMLPGNDPDYREYLGSLWAAKMAA